MQNQALFSLIDKSRKLKCCLLHFLFGVLRAKIVMVIILGIQIFRIFMMSW